MKPLMTDATSRLAETYVSHAPHALLLSGPDGIGLKTLATWLAGKIGSIADIVEPTRPSGSTVLSIQVERVRGLYESTRTGSKNLRVIIIDDADKMNTVAQNALLKLLEEPSASTRFILLSHRPELLLETIHSRVQWFSVPSLDLMTSRRVLKSHGITDEKKIAQLLYVAEGLPAMLTRLAGDDAVFRSMASDMAQAREFIEATRYDKLRIASSFKEDRAAAIGFLDTVVLLLRNITAKAPSAALYTQIDRLLRARELILANGNVRLQLAHAVVY